MSDEPTDAKYTHVVNLAKASEAADRGLDALIDYLADLPTIEEAGRSADALDEAGMPVHLRFPLTADHQGPATGDDFHHWGCWCVDGSKCEKVFRS